MSKNKKTERHTIRMTKELDTLMAQIIEREGHGSVNDFLNTAVRYYVDERSDAAGSRRHFSRTMQARMDRLEALLIWNALQGQVLASSGTFTVLDQLYPDSEEEPPTPDAQIEHANKTSRRLMNQFIDGQRDVLPALEEYVKKQRAKKRE